MDTLDPGCSPNTFTQLRGDWGWSSPLQGEFAGRLSPVAFPVAAQKLRSHQLKELLSRGFSP